MSGRWITEKAFADLHSLHRQTLANWQSADLKAGRTEAEPGYPQYRRYGRSVRYWYIAEVSPARLVAAA
jgi:hypothetical protein